MNMLGFSFLSPFTMSPDQKGIETLWTYRIRPQRPFTMSPDQKGIETRRRFSFDHHLLFTMSPDQKGIETRNRSDGQRPPKVHNEPRSKGD